MRNWSAGSARQSNDSSLRTDKPADEFAPRGFVRFRQSKWFLRLLFMACGGWVAWNILPFVQPHFDPDLSGINFLLSFEASCAACFILDDGARQLAVLLRILRGHGEMMTRIADLVAKVEARDRRIERLLKHIERRTENLSEEPPQS